VQALEFVRQRHNIPGPVTDDLGRELRQRYFLSAAFKKVLSAGVLLNPIRLHDLINAVDGAFTFDNNNFDITKFAEQMTNLSAGNIVGRSIPTEGDFTASNGQDAIRVDYAAVRKAVQDAFSGTTGAGTSGKSGKHRRHHRHTSASTGLTTPAKQSCVY
jgi:anionic cell wall polymer biosynthesis LytR-Cps2A-Psr (LCP) family protein